MTSCYYMNITLQISNGYKYSFLLRNDFTLNDFIIATNSNGICIKDYLFYAHGKQLNLEDEIMFNSQKRLFSDTFIQATPKLRNDSNVLIYNEA